MGKNWDAVAKAINTRMAELEMTQRELSEQSGVSTATLRQLQNNYSPRRRSPRLLSAISTTLRWPEDHLQNVLQGDEASPSGAGPDDLTSIRAELQALRERVENLEQRLD